MRKLLLSMLTTLLVMGLLGGGALALFQDSETSSGNTFTAGTMDLKIRDGGQDWSDGITVAEWTMSDMEPGVSSDNGSIGIRNDGSITPDHMKISASYTCTEGAPVGDMDLVDQANPTNWDSFAKYLEITYLRYYNTTWYMEYKDGAWSIDGSPPYPAGYVATDWEIADGDGDGWVSLKDFKNDPLDNLPPPGINSFSPTHLDMTVLFRGDAGNDFQGDTLDLTMTFTLNQDSSQ